MTMAIAQEREDLQLCRRRTILVTLELCCDEPKEMMVEFDPSDPSKRIANELEAGRRPQVRTNRLPLAHLSCASE